MSTEENKECPECGQTVTVMQAGWQCVSCGLHKSKIKGPVLTHHTSLRPILCGPCKTRGRDGDLLSAFAGSDESIVMQCQVCKSLIVKTPVPTGLFKQLWDALGKIDEGAGPS